MKLHLCVCLLQCFRLQMVFPCVSVSDTVLDNLLDIYCSCDAFHWQLHFGYVKFLGNLKS